MTKRMNKKKVTGLTNKETRNRFIGDLAKLRTFTSLLPRRIGSELLPTRQTWCQNLYKVDRARAMVVRRACLSSGATEAFKRLFRGERKFIYLGQVLLG
ncbi:hypothetical protein A4A49_51757 [Nicotiana attenuata]|uniref:Uncharacterized protein n=1 Tax=Nicotiana attenuata TaxID=49451 RepID=A0A1J6I858_NICAT|nr:hypothetical protein A4A49_51757 [Nicotiana attenuata]